MSTHLCWLDYTAVTRILQDVGPIGRQVCKRWKTYGNLLLDDFTRLQHQEVAYLYDGVHEDTTTLDRLLAWIEYLRTHHPAVYQQKQLHRIQCFTSSSSRYKDPQPYIMYSDQDRSKRRPSNKWNKFADDGSSYWWYGYNCTKRGELRIHGNRLEYYVSINGHSRMRLRKTHCKTLPYTRRQWDVKETIRVALDDQRDVSDSESSLSD